MRMIEAGVQNVCRLVSTQLISHRWDKDLPTDLTPLPPELTFSSTAPCAFAPTHVNGQ